VHEGGTLLNRFSIHNHSRRVRCELDQMVARGRGNVPARVRGAGLGRSSSGC
jgi:hypothetical protein